jgi:programmed cell death protein 4
VPTGSLAGDIVEHAKRMLSREHGGGLLDRTWGPGDGRPVEELKVALDQCLEEYLLSSDLTEAARCIKELNAKLFYHEVVKRAVVMVISRTHEDQIQMSKLLKFLRDSDQMSSTQAIKGFRRLYGILSDLALDAPNAKAVVNDFTQRAIADGVLAADFKA